MGKCLEKDCNEEIELEKINVELDRGKHTVKINGGYCPPHYKEVIEFLADQVVIYRKGRVEDHKFPFW